MTTSCLGVDPVGACRSKYHVMEHARGFSVEALDRPPVTVSCEPTFLEVEPSLIGKPQRFGFYDFRRLVRAVAEGLMRDWKPPRGMGPNYMHIREWAIDQTARAITHRAHRQWKRLLGFVDQPVLAVHRSVFAATMDGAVVASCPELYRSPYLVRDIVRYRAAAIAARHVSSLGEWARAGKVESSRHASAL